MENRKCSNCIKQNRMNCPNSWLCYSRVDKPYFEPKKKEMNIFERITNFFSKKKDSSEVMDTIGQGKYIAGIDPYKDSNGNEVEGSCGVIKQTEDGTIIQVLQPNMDKLHSKDLIDDIMALAKKTGIIPMENENNYVLEENSLTDKKLSNIIDQIPSEVFESEKVILTGSVLLCAYGLLSSYNDIDIIVVNPNKGYWSDLLSQYGQNNQSYTHIKIPIGENLDLNILRDDNYDGKPIIENTEIGLFYDSLEHAIRAKGKLARIKDLSHFRIMRSRLNYLLDEKI